MFVKFDLSFFGGSGTLAVVVSSEASELGNGFWRPRTGVAAGDEPWTVAVARTRWKTVSVPGHSGSRRLVMVFCLHSYSEKLTCKHYIHFLN